MFCFQVGETPPQDVLVSHGTDYNPDNPGAG